MRVQLRLLVLLTIGLLLVAKVAPAQDSLVPVPVTCGLAQLPDPVPATTITWGNSDTGSWCMADFSAAFAQLPSGTWLAVIDEAANTARALPVPIATAPATPGALLPPGLLAAGMQSVAECGGRGTITTDVTQTVGAIPATITVAWDYPDTALPGCLAAAGFDVSVDGGDPVQVGATDRTAPVTVATPGPHTVRVRAVSGSAVSYWSELDLTVAQGTITTKPRPPGQPRIVGK